MGLLESIFLKTASDKKLAKKREKIRVKRNRSYDDKKYDKYFWKLNKYDNEIGPALIKNTKKHIRTKKYGTVNMDGIYQTMINKT